MGKFTTFDAPIGTKGPISVQKVTAKDFGGDAGFGTIGEALKGAADDVEKRQIIQKRIQVKKENADINQANIDNQGFGASLFRDAAKNADANATDFTTNVLAEYDRNAEGRLALAPNDRVRAAMKLDFSRTRNILVEKAALFESTTRGKNEVNVFAGNGDKAGNIVFETPTEDQYDATLKARRAEIANMSIPAHKKEEFLREEIKSLRFKQYAGQLEYAVTAEQVDQILGDRPEDELTAKSFTQLGNAGEAKKRRFKTEDRLTAVERRADIRDAQSAVRVTLERLGRGEMLDEATKKHTEELVGAVGDPVTSEMWFNATTVGRSISTWMKLPSADLEDIVAGLQTDVGTAGATALESKLLDAAKSVLSKTETGERRDQAEIDDTVRVALDNLDKRLATDADLSRDPDVLIVRANLAAASPRLRQQVRELFAQNETLKGLDDLSVADLRQFVKDAERDADLSDINTVTRDVAVKVLNDMVRITSKNYPDYQLKKDPTTFIPVDETNPATMKSREASMEQGAADYNKAKQFHTTAEKAAIGDRLSGMSSDKQLEFIAGYTQSMGVENAVIALSELGETHPLMAFVGAGIASDPSYLAVGNLVLHGQQKLKEQGGSLIQIETTSTKGDMEIAIGEELLGALDNQALPPHWKAAVKSAAMALLAVNAVEEAKDAVHMALGGDGDLGGIQTFNGKRFAAPVGVSDDMIAKAFEDNPATLTELSVDGSPPITKHGLPVSADEITSDGTLERVGPDMFFVRMPDGILLQGAPGTAYTLHITQARLRALGIKP